MDAPDGREGRRSGRSWDGLRAGCGRERERANPEQVASCALPLLGAAAAEGSTGKRQEGRTPERTRRPEALSGLPVTAVNVCRGVCVSLCVVLKVHPSARGSSRRGEGVAPLGVDSDARRWSRVGLSAGETDVATFPSPQSKVRVGHRSFELLVTRSPRLWGSGTGRGRAGRPPRCPLGDRGMRCGGPSSESCISLAWGLVVRSLLTYPSRTQQGLSQCCPA
jgi:hypothetical protein